MAQNGFYALLSRMKYINRWGLMKNTRAENLSEHSLETAYIAHALGVINNKIFAGNINPERLALLGMFHDVTEIITGDMPTPVKYFSDEVRLSYKSLEKNAKDKLLLSLPADFRSVYEDLLMETEKEEAYWKLVKAADKISAYLKCLEEISVGNPDFKDALISTKKAVESLNLREADYFIRHFADAYSKTLDENI